MRRITWTKPSPAMAVSLLALFVALGGTGYAAATISGSKLKNRSVANAKVKKNTLGGTEINETKLGKVRKAKTADRAIKADTATTASLASDSNLLGGLAKGTYLRNYQVVTADGTGTTDKNAIATCPGETRIIGGGAQIEGAGASSAVLLTSYPGSGTTATPPSQWSAAARNNGTENYTLKATAICADVN